MTPLRRKFAAASAISVAAGAAAVLDGAIATRAAAREGVDRLPRVEVEDWRVHDAGQIGCLITNWGQIGSRPGSQAPYAEAPAAEWPPGSGVEYLWMSGLCVGARRDGVRHVTTGAYENEFAPSTLAVDRIYATFAGAPGGSRFPSPDADDDGDGSVDEDRIDGVDNDGDILVDEDFAAVSDQMFVCQYDDTDPAIRQRYPEHAPLGLRVRQNSLVWARTDDDDFIGLDLEIANSGDEKLTDLYAGLFADFDIGRRDRPQGAEDDRGGFWEGTVHVEFEGTARAVDVSLGYMFDADGDAGQAPGYIGYVFLGASSPRHLQVPVALRNFRLWDSAAPYESGGLPRTDSQRFEALAGLSPQSLAPPESGERSPGVASEDGDYRPFVSIGPVGDLEPGESMHVAAAMVLGGGLQALLQNAARARLLYEGGMADCDGDPVTPERCAVRWTTPGIVPVLLEELSAQRAADGVRLQWKLHPTALRGLHTVQVQRANAAAGPYETISSAPLQPLAAMWFLDPDPPFGTLWYRLVLEDREHRTTVSPPLRVDGTNAQYRTFLDLPEVVGPEGVLLRYGIGRQGDVRIRISDVRGRLIRLLPQGRRDAGYHTVMWDGRDVRGRRPGRGMYLLQLEAGGVSCQRKLVLLPR